MNSVNAMTMRNQYRKLRSVARMSAAGIALLIVSVAKADPPKIAPAYQGKLIIEAAADLGSGNRPTQMAWGPDGRLYARTETGGVRSFKYNAATGQLTNPVLAASNVSGIGIAFHKDVKGKIAMYLTVYDAQNTGSLLKLTDDNGNGVFGEVGETRVKIVTSIPTGDHAVDQLLVQGDTLYVGIGLRTINGRKGGLTSGSQDDFGSSGFWSGGNGNTHGDAAYGGTISYIEDLNSVSDVQDSANAYAPNTPHDQNFWQQNAAPYTLEITVPPASLKGKLRIHSAGTRNPFGMAFDKNGDLWFTNNFNRVETNGDGTAGFGYLYDSLANADFTKDVYDQVFKAVKGADYGYSNINWRDNNAAPILDSANANHLRVYSATYDNLFNTGPYFLHDPANPDGMGPSSSANGCAFFYAANLPAELQGNLFITRFNSPISDGKGKTLTYQDVVALDTTNGKVRRVAQEFTSPLCALSDNAQRLLIGDYGTGKIWVIRPTISRLSASVTLTRPGAIQAAVKLTNVGERMLINMKITGAKLNGKATTTALPVAVGSLATGGSASRTLFFPASAATPGQASILTISGTYQGGSFGLSQRVTAP